MPASPLPAWDCALGHSICATLETAIAREWLATNGLGGYAAGTLAGATTRRYHGLLVAALRPPVARTVLVTKVDETVTLAAGATVALGANEYADGTITPTGYVYLDEFALEDSVVRLRYRLPGDLTLEKRIWMEHRHNTTYVRYHLLAPSPLPCQPPTTVTLALSPFCVARDYHSHQHGNPDWRFLVEVEPGGCRVRANAAAPVCRLNAGPAATFNATGVWYWHVLHRVERERGLDDEEDVYQPGTFSVRLAPGATLTLVASADEDLGAGFGGPAHEATGAAALQRERARAADLLARASQALAPAAGATLVTTTAAEIVSGMSPIEAAAPLAPILGRLALAADQFLVARTLPASARAEGETAMPATGQPAASDHSMADPHHTAGLTVIAGYPWFTDWGRDTMIALAGLTLPTGRAEEARLLLRTFARLLDRGMLPNRFPDSGAPLSDADYNTADATLWLFVALDRYLTATGDAALLAELWPGLASVVDWHQRGTRFGIGVDPRDGLLRAGAPGVQLTWMDAKEDDWVVTPRRGKPVEINGLWHHALALMERWAPQGGQSPEPYRQARERAGAAFAARFWNAAGGYLYDVVDVDGVDDASDAALRPNQLIALALPHCPLDADRALLALAAVESALLTPLGLRTLAPSDPAFLGAYRGDQRARDAAYHQGTVWPWLIGPYLDARRRLAADPQHEATARARLLAAFRDHLLDAGLGSISEIAEGTPPFRPVGCFAQAWSVAELLRGWSTLDYSH
ncbi:MAG TPA: amylo-alpha-1,6-glucosidase [Ktedonobacterales bacterium]|nr:amylo-alpha-1,6-glucosidase [Ktedonobacterales bacterium]